MKQKISQLKAHPKYNHWMHWGKLISITGSAQVIVQAVGFVSGILIIRLLPTQEYALYTLANTMLGTMTILADSGISTGVMAQGGKVWQDKEKLGAVLATGLDLRRRFAIGSLIISTPILFYLLLHNGASWLMSLLIVLSLIPAFYAALSDSLLEIVPKLHQSILPLQKNQVTVGLGRLFLSAITLFVFPWTFVAILASGIPRIYGNVKLKKISSEFVNLTQHANTEVKEEILKLVKKNLPAAIYFCISGQISIWIISIFGNSTSIAQIGALGRVSMILNIVGALFSILIVPRFSRIQNQPLRLFSLFSKIIITSICIMVLIILGAHIFSNQLLWILGKNYSGLNSELDLLLIGNSLNLIMGVALTLTINRGWILTPIISISLNLLPTIIGCSIFDISTVKGVLLMNNLISLVQMLLYISYGYYKIFNDIKNEKSISTIL